MALNQGRRITSAPSESTTSSRTLHSYPWREARRSSKRFSVHNGRQGLHVLQHCLPTVHHDCPTELDSDTNVLGSGLSRFRQQL